MAELPTRCPLKPLPPFLPPLPMFCTHTSFSFSAAYSSPPSWPHQLTHSPQSVTASTFVGLGRLISLRDLANSYLALDPGEQHPGLLLGGLVQLTAHFSRNRSWRAFGSIAHKTATLILFEKSCPYSDRSFTIWSSRCSMSLSALVAFVILFGDNTAEIALMPDANVRG